MNKVMIIIAVLSLAACGENRAVQLENRNCYSEATTGGVNIICPSGTTFLANGSDGTSGKDGTDGTDGKDGKDGDVSKILSTTAMPVANVCHNIAPGIWAKNEGFKADIYNNDQCSHQGKVGTYNDTGTLCNNLAAFNEHSEDHNGELCWVGNYLVTIEGVYADMVIKVLDFN